MQPTDLLRDLIPQAIFECRMQISVGAFRDDGIQGEHRIRHIPILGGTVEGARFRGQVLPGGADHQSIRLRDGLALIDAQYAIRHDDGTVIRIRNTGVRHGPPAVMARLAAGEPVDPATYYFRTTPVFEVAAGPHDWLTHHLFVGVGARDAQGVVIDLYRIT